MLAWSTTPVVGSCEFLVRIGLVIETSMIRRLPFS
jgi:hypothetical protein